MNARQQGQIAKMALTHSQVMANLMTFQANGLVFTDSAISSKDKYTPRELILGIIGLSEENKNKKVFVLVEKDYHGNIILVYKKRFHKDTSTIANFLVAVMVK